MQTDDDELPQVLLALDCVVIHLHKTWALIDLASSCRLTFYLGPAYVSDTPLLV